MGNFKVKVDTPEESKEAQELFFKLGGKWGLGGCKIQNTDEPYLYLENGLVLYGFSVETFNTEQHKELALPELSDMVVLKRNDVNDATHENNVFKYVELTDGWYYFDLGCTDKWQKSSGAKPEYYEKLKPIEKKEMKEYLDKDYVLREVKQTSGDNRVPSDWIEIPEGAESYNQYTAGEEDNTFFLKKIGDMYYFANEESHYLWEWYAGELRGHEFVLWQRATHPEELPFIDDEPKSLNDQYAEIEQVRQQTIEVTLAERQGQYGCYEDVAYITQEILKALQISGYDRMPATHKESMHMIASKMARLVCGDCNSIDGWHDIAGYATLIERMISGDEIVSKEMEKQHTDSNLQ